MSRGNLAPPSSGVHLGKLSGFEELEDRLDLEKRAQRNHEPRALRRLDGSDHDCNHCAHLCNVEVVLRD